MNINLQTELAKDARSKLEIADPDREFWQEICKAFLKGLWKGYPSIEAMKTNEDVMSP